MHSFYRDNQTIYYKLLPIMAQSFSFDTHPLVILEDDEDDRHIYENLLREIAPHLQLRFFISGEDLLAALQSKSLQPFLIISEVHLSGMTGMELRKKLDEDQSIRTKAIPFVFFSHPIFKRELEEAYHLTIQGFFEKSPDLAEFGRQLDSVVRYWSDCKHPNRSDIES
ncbi:PleD family two-component system response regulator [Siphonobacter sp. BAB-5385]|uniref:response regulator n=1 Tax=Siphonobacter sp. BAB-5385 TaxID=1864822 RepID=UPI001140063C|nr:response regulator [Siphonobacter sp. BAB-5385]